MSQMERDLLLILPQIIVLLSAIAGIILEMFRKPLFSLWAIVAGMIVASGLSLSRLGLVETAFSDTFRIDALNHWAVILLGFGNILFVLLARQELKGTDREGTVYSLLTFSALGAMLLAGSGDLMFIVIGILILGLSGFALAAYKKTAIATEGAMKYFIYGSVTGAIMIFGLSYWVGISGTTLFSGLIDTPRHLWVFVVGFTSLLIGIGYAASIFPFHFWTPDTFEGSPVSIAAYLSVTPKIGAVFALAQLTRNLAIDSIDWQIIVSLLAVLSMTFGNVLALLQHNVVRLLAYSTVAQVGYFLLAIISGQESQLASKALIVFGAAYLSMNTGAFAIVQSTGTTIDQFKGLGRMKTFTGIAMIVFLFSLVGIPPLAGFAGKFLLFGSAIGAGYTWVAVIAIINSVISLAVYLRIIVPAFFQSAQQHGKPHPGKLIEIVWMICLIITVFMGIALELIL